VGELLGFRGRSSALTTLGAPLCSGLARCPLKAVARVRIPSGLPRITPAQGLLRSGRQLHHLRPGTRRVHVRERRRARSVHRIGHNVEPIAEQPAVAARGLPFILAPPRGRVRAKMTRPEREGCPQATRTACPPGMGELSVRSSTLRSEVLRTGLLSRHRQRGEPPGPGESPVLASPEAVSY
jgi:hypothetical protein